MIRVQQYTIIARAPYALFTRPEFRAERRSYECPTPPAFAGMMERIIRRQNFNWILDSLGILKPINFGGLTRNEVKASPRRGCDLDVQHTQRRTELLVDVAYVADVSLVCTDDVESSERAKLREMSERYLRLGKCTREPYLGCRECTASVQLVTGAPPKALNINLDLGRMPYSYTYRPDGTRASMRHFDAKIRQGYLQLPEEAL